MNFINIYFRQCIKTCIIGLAAALLIGCTASRNASPQTQNNGLPADTRIRLGAITDLSGQPDSEFRKKRLASAIQQSLTRAGLLVSHSGSHIYTITAEITHFTGSPLPNRRINVKYIKVQAYLNDAQGNRIGNISAERGIKAGSTIPVGMGENVFDQLGDDIAADIKAHTESR